ncbi:hypothetical protein BDF14DRAFT_1740750 [Spinellus fusiger]|nr:hypothetical protein BDF14DRAFT_1740750 [Spinellus fusiger]
MLFGLKPFKREPFKDESTIAIENIKTGLRTCEDIKEYYRQRAQIEQEYGQRLLQLNHVLEGHAEEGLLGQALSTIPNVLEITARAHIDLADQVRRRLEQPMDTLLIEHREESSAQQQRIDSSRQLKNTYHENVVRTRDIFRRECLQLEQLEKHLADQKGYLSQEELQQLKQDIEESTHAVHTSDIAYKEAVDTQNDIIAKYNGDWKAALDEFRALAETRIDFIKDSLWTRHKTGLATNSKKNCEKMRVTVKATDVEQDRPLLMEKYSGIIPTAELVQYESYESIQYKSPHVLSRMTQEEEDHHNVTKSRQDVMDAFEEVESMLNHVGSRPYSPSSEPSSNRNIFIPFGVNEGDIDSDGKDKTDKPIFISEDSSKNIVTDAYTPQDSISVKDIVSTSSSLPLSKDVAIDTAATATAIITAIVMENETTEKKKEKSSPELVENDNNNSNSNSNSNSDSDSDNDSDGQKVARYPRPTRPPQEEKWIISTSRRPQQVPVRAQNTQLFARPTVTIDTYPKRQEAHQDSIPYQDSPMPSRLSSESSLRASPVSKSHSPLYTDTLPYSTTAPAPVEARNLIASARAQLHFPTPPQQTGYLKDNGQEGKSYEWQSKPSVTRAPSTAGMPQSKSMHQFSTPGTTNASPQLHPGLSPASSQSAHTPGNLNRPASVSALNKLKDASATVVEKKGSRFSLALFGKKDKSKKETSEPVHVSTAAPTVESPLPASHGPPPLHYARALWSYEAKKAARWLVGG